MNTRLFFLPLVVIILIAASVGGYFWWQKGKTPSEKKIAGVQGQPGNPISDILYLTSPVTEFSGKVEKVSGDSIFLSGKYTITPPPTPANAPTNSPGQVITIPPVPPSKNFTYKVNVPSYTVITRPDSPVKYLLKKATPTPSPKLTIQDIQVGKIVTVYSMTDLRTLKSTEFDASTIKLPPVLNVITGKITSINAKDGVIILKASLPIRPGGLEPTLEKPKEVEYAISVTADSEISRLGQTQTPAKASATPKPAEPLEYKLSDLKNDIQITVFTDTDVIDNQKVKALMIEPPIDLLPASLSSPSATPSPSPKA